MTSHAYLNAKSMPTVPAPYGLSWFLCPGSTSKIHHVLHGMSLFPRCSNLLPLHLCSWNNNTSTLNVASLRNLLCLRILRGSLRSLKLWVKTCNFIWWLLQEVRIYQEEVFLLVQTLCGYPCTLVSYVWSFPYYLMVWGRCGAINPNVCQNLHANHLVGGRANWNGMSPISWPSLMGDEVRSLGARGTFQALWNDSRTSSTSSS